MWPFHPDLLTRPVPRYTSFPTAAEFTDGVGAPELGAALEEVSGTVSLYIHVPFCEQICWYCGCNTGRSNKVARLTSYLDALHREIALVGQRLPRGTRVQRIAFGGGSPNALSPLEFVRLVDALTVHLPLYDPVVSIELDPRTLAADWGMVIRCIGITRASLGVQTLSPRLQAAIGRVQPDALIARTTEQLRAAGITSLNFDLMYGLPGQTDADLAETLARSIELGADRIALFGYAHVPHLIPRQKQIDAADLPDMPARFRMAWNGWAQLTAAGYQPVGFDHFALPGDALAQAALAGRLHRNFQGFTEDQAPVLIGLGASAISQFPHLIVQNEKNAGRYRMLLSQDRLTGTHGVRRSAEDQRRGLVIESLLCHNRASLPLDLMQEQIGALAPFRERGLIDLTDDVLELRPEGLPYARTVAALFDPYRQDGVRRFSSAV
ncbi:oxygen-independent coproporphyrinogen III oxidase [Novosphingobium piscinae]|uniref:Coproporphyrinogen-III oxidase n=1 Tax=Novosphingobium piscinae TaxID=1507448 RepID=A0A7X1KRM0_9SPHN|nr:oxygen-independent coproporphyrinogen III oxidase [Novosphingobium piscinae]MBC2670708.1 oxygen-independent coproporphyrinogen III oxidase [Novosphingobium piscinae]